MKDKTYLVAAISTVVVALAFVISAPAQVTNTGVLFGVVKDQQGAVIPGVKLTATEIQTGYKGTATSGPDGGYRVEALPPGTYQLKAEKTGFQTFVDTSLILYVRQQRRVDITLQLGQVTQSVTVKASGSVIETQGATQTSSLDAKETHEYPYYMRGFGAGGSGSPMYAQLTALGVSRSNNTTNGGTSTDWVSEIDGNETSNRGTYRPSEEFVREVRVFALNAPAEFRSSSTAVGVSRSGTNDFHGLFRVNVENTALNALGPCGNCTRGPGIPSHELDYSAGGPIWKNHTFFFVSGNHLNESYVYAQTGFRYPQPAMRTGDLSIYSTPIIDPTTGKPFPGNIIPPDRISPIAAKLISTYMPLPNNGGPTNLNDNYVTSWVNPSQYNNENVRIDHQLTSNNRLFFTYSRVAYPAEGGRNIGNTADENADPRIANFDVWEKTNNYTVQDTHIFSPSVLNELTFAIAKETLSETTGELQGAQVLSDLGISLGGRPAVPGIGFPSIPITGFSGFALRTGNFLGNQYQQYTIRDSVSISRGTHLIKAGVEMLNNRPQYLSEGPGSWGSFTFDGSITGQPFADFLLGLPNFTSYTTPRTTENDHWTDLGFFVQDTWKVRRNLTLDLGFRNQIYTIPFDANGEYYNFSLKDMKVVVPDQNALNKVVAGYPIPVETAAQAGYPTKLLNGEKFMPEPRIGIAWQMRPNTVLRLGYGLYHTLPPSGTASILGSRATGPFSLNQSYGPNTIVNGVPQFTFADPFPTGPGAVPLQSVTAFPVNFERPYEQQWNVTVSHQLPWHVGVNVSYVGTHANHLGYHGDFNKPMPSLQPYQRRFPGFSSINVYDFGATSDFQALEASIERQFSSGLYFRAGLEKAKALSDVSMAFGGGGLYTGGGIENPYDRHANWGTHNGFEPTTLKVITVYTLPFGSGQYFSTPSSVINKVIGGWTLSSYIFASAGATFTPTFSGSDPSNTGTFGGVADVTCNPGGRVSEFFFWNRSCFAVPPAGRFGDAAQGSLRGPAWWMQNLGIFKTIGLGEWGHGIDPKLKIEAQAWDPWNTPTQRNVSTNISNSSFGYAAKGSTDGMTTGWRYIQLNASISF